MIKSFYTSYDMEIEIETQHKNSYFIMHSILDFPSISRLDCITKKIENS